MHTPLDQGTAPDLPHARTPGRLPSAAVAQARVTIKRRLRRAGLVIAWDTPTRDLLVLALVLKNVEG